MHVCHPESFSFRVCVCVCFVFKLVLYGFQNIALQFIQLFNERVRLAHQMTHYIIVATAATVTTRTRNSIVRTDDFVLRCDMYSHKYRAYKSENIFLAVVLIAIERRKKKCYTKNEQMTPCNGSHAHITSRLFQSFLWFVFFSVQSTYIYIYKITRRKMKMCISKSVSSLEWLEFQTIEEKPM